MKIHRETWTFKNRLQWKLNLNKGRGHFESFIAAWPLTCDGTKFYTAFFYPLRISFNNKALPRKSIVQSNNYLNAKTGAAADWECDHVKSRCWVVFKMAALKSSFFFLFIFSILVRLVFLIPNIIKAILFILDSDVVTILSVKTQVTLWITPAQSIARRKPFKWILSGTLELKPTLRSMCIAILRCALQMLRILHVNARLWLIATLMLENGEQLKLMNLWCIASRLVLIITRR